jgi:hypothetical protein
MFIFWELFSIVDVVTIQKFLEKLINEKME